MDEVVLCLGDLTVGGKFTYAFSTWSNAVALRRPAVGANQQLTAITFPLATRAPHSWYVVTCHNAVYGSQHLNPTPTVLTILLILPLSPVPTMSRVYKVHIFPLSNSVQK